MNDNASLMYSNAASSDADEAADRQDAEDGADAEPITDDTAPLHRGPPAGSAGLDEGRLAAWIAAIVDHDERALAALYDAAMPLVFGIVMRMVRRRGLAEEVVEDTFFQVWRQAARFDPARGRALTWLLGMARSRAIDAIRREARFQHESLDTASAPDVEDPAPAADDLLAAARGHADLRRALMQLNTQPRQLVAMAFFKGLSHEEIASQTALPLGTVKSQIRRALQTLRQVLGDSGLHPVAA
jgi:RNA polymerase sigma factor (sigma-70 family)